MTAATCVSCGASFTPSPRLLERFPGWVPSECPDCYRRTRGGASTGRGGRGRRRDTSPRSRDLDALGDGGPDTGVFTDGSASPNPGPGGWAAVYVIDGEIVDEVSGGEAHTTNNRMELTAIMRGIELVPEGTPATVYSDSNLAVRTLTEWAPGWERRGWRRKTGPVENLDLVRPLFERLRERPEITLSWIRAHVGNRWNEYADRLANTAAGHPRA